MITEVRSLDSNRWIELDIDVPAIIREYAQRYVDDGYQHDTLDEAAEQCARDLKLGDADIERWFKDAVRDIRRK